MNYRKSMAVSLAVAAITTFGVVSVPAHADGDNARQAPGRAALQYNARQAARYSDAELLQLLLAGQGPIAETHPDLVRLLGFDVNKPHTDETALNFIIDDYLSKTPEFRRYAVGFQSGDQVRVQRALRDFSISFNHYVKSLPQQNDSQSGEFSAQASGWFWMGAYVAIYANAVGVANAVVYANAGVATFALATLAVVTWYLEDGTPVGSELERNKLVTGLATSLG